VAATFSDADSATSSRKKYPELLITRHLAKIDTGHVFNLISCRAALCIR
jgi:hypothetical protein